MATWKMKDGTKIKISDMDDNHLINTIRMLKRYEHVKTCALVNAGEQALSTMQGEMAIDSIERDLEYLYQHGLEPYEVHPKFPKLLEEAEKRGLPCGKL